MRFGLSYRRQHRAELLELGPGGGPELLELIPDHFFADLDAIDALRAWPLLLHDVGLSIGSPEPLSDRRLRRLREVVERAHPLLFTDHLAWTRVGPIGLGHLAPIWPTQGLLRRCVEKVDQLQQVLGLPVALENISAAYVIPGELPVWSFMSELLERSGAGLYLDLTNIVIDARNAGEPAQKALRRWPLERTRALHLAGGHQSARSGRWVDSHSAPVDAEALELLRELRGQLPEALGLVLERDEHIPCLPDLLGELRALRAHYLGPEPLE